MILICIDCEEMVKNAVHKELETMAYIANKLSASPFGVEQTCQTFLDLAKIIEEKGRRAGFSIRS